MENLSHHNTALYYIWENNCSSPSACFFDLQKGDICVLGRNDGYKVIYIDKPVNSSALWNDFHVIDSLTEYNLNLPKEHEILCMTGSDKAEGNEIVLRRLIDCCKNEWIKDFFVESKSVLSGITEFWNLRQLIRLTGDYSLMYIPVAKVSTKDVIAVSSGNSLYYIPEVESFGEELVSRNVESGDFCICRKGNGLIFFEINHDPVSTDNYSSFQEIETVEETDIMFPLVFLQLCKTGVKKEKNTKFINRFKSAFHNRKSLEILDLALKIVQGENLSLPHVSYSASFYNDVPEYENIVVEKVQSTGQDTASQKSEDVEKTMASFSNLPEDVQLDIEIEFLKSIRKQSDTRKRFRRMFSSAASFYSFVKKAEEQKNNLSDIITSVYVELLNRIVNTLEGNSCEKNIVKVFTDAIKELQKAEIKDHGNLSPLPSAIEDRKGDRWTKEEEQLVIMYFQGGYSPKEIANAVGRSEVSIYMRLDKLGLIQYPYGDNIDDIKPVSDEVNENSKNEEDGLYVENLCGSSSLYNKDEERLFTATGKLKIINGKVYRFNFKDICFTVKRIEKIGNCWSKSGKLLVAYDDSALHININPHNFIDDIEDFDDCDDIIDNRLKYRGKWYNFDGEEIADDSNISTGLTQIEEIAESANENSYENIEIEHIYLDSKGVIVNKEIVCERLKLDISESGSKTMNSDGGEDKQIDNENSDAYKAAMSDIEKSISNNLVKDLLLPKDSPVSFTVNSIRPNSQLNIEFIPKGKLANINLFAKNQYDVLWMMSLVDIVWKERLSEEFTLEQIACMEIANLWELQNADKTLKNADDFENCKEFLSTEISVNEEMSNFDIYKAIKNYPICGAFEDFVDILTENSHLNILKAWIDESDETIMINKSSVFTNACLFSVSKQKYETKIKLNPSWRYYLINNKKELRRLFIFQFYSHIDKITSLKYTELEKDLTDNVMQLLQRLQVVERNIQDIDVYDKQASDLLRYYIGEMESAQRFADEYSTSLLYKKIDAPSDVIARRKQAAVHISTAASLINDNKIYDLIDFLNSKLYVNLAQYNLSKEIEELNKAVKLLESGDVPCEKQPILEENRDSNSKNVRIIHSKWNSAIFEGFSNLDWKNYAEEQRMLYPNHGAPWTKEDRDSLIKLFVEENYSVEDLSKVFLRNEHAIELQLEKAGVAIVEHVEDALL